MTVILTMKEHVAHVVLSREDKCNAFNMTMFKQMDAVIKQLKADKTLRGVLLYGAGEHFCSGLDVSMFKASSRTAVLKLLWKIFPWHPNLAQRVSAGWRQLPVPVIAVIEGCCYGAGLQVALGADFRIASPSARFAVMEGRWGLIADMAGTLAMRDNMPLDRALFLSMTANEIDAQTAKSYQLITEVSDKPMEFANRYMDDIRARSPDAIALTKHLLYQTWHSAKGRVLLAETWNQLKVFLTPNQRIATKRSRENKAFPYKKRFWF